MSKPIDVDIACVIHFKRQIGSNSSVFNDTTASEIAKGYALTNNNKTQNDDI